MPTRIISGGGQSGLCVYCRHRGVAIADELHPLLSRNPAIYADTGQPRCSVQHRPAADILCFYRLTRPNTHTNANTNAVCRYHLAYVGYEDMMKSKHSQSFVISGESGAGKSESTKHLINHIIENSKSNKKSLESRIQMINPLLEAFGNAKTVMNNNSSRFGKYIEIKFSPVDGAVMGAAISEYLLEKSRVCSQQPNEQNYHIFYILSAGMAQCEVLSYDLGKPSSHNYLNSPGAPTDAQIMCKDNVESFNELLETFIKMQFDDEDVQSMLTILCAVLLIGDIEFKLNSSDEVEYAGDSSKLLGEIAKLLNVPVAELEPAFLAVTQLMGSEAVKIPFNSVEKAVDNRDAFAKAFYARLFGWIVTHCNQTLIDPETVSGDFLSLGILDIFGFEDFANNSLEQLCINVTNEQLHTFFNETIFKAEAESYKAEGVDGADIAWENNEPTLMMLRARPGGLLAILDEESNPKIKSSDLQFTEKAGAALAKHASGAYKSAKSSKELSFTIVHYAGPVKYNSTNFLEKDRDTLSAAFAPVLKFSQDTMVSQLWSAKSGATGTFKVHKSMKGRPPKSKKKLQNTVCAHFSASLTDLLDKIKASNPHFVRCLKPNAEKVPKKFDNAQMMRQLKYAGVLETVKVRKLGYAIRETFEDFVKHYKNMAFPHGQKVPSTAKSCEVIMEKTNIEGYKIGKSKIFLKYFHVEQLAALRKKEVWALEFVKKVCSGHIARVRFKRIKARCAEQTAMIAAMIAFAEDSANAVREKVVKVTAMDAAATKKRKFVADLKKKAAAEEKEKVRHGTAVFFWLLVASFVTALLALLLLLLLLWLMMMLLLLIDTPCPCSLRHPSTTTCSSRRRRRLESS